MTPDLYHPVLDCLLRGLPHLYRQLDAPAGTALLLEITGECGGHWFLSRGTGRWELVKQSAPEFAACVTIPQEIAWRVFTKGIDRESARAQIQMEGDHNLGNHALELTAIVA